jgi:hypothetical protein
MDRKFDLDAPAVPGWGFVSPRSVTMFRKILIMFVMTPLIVAAIVADTSLPVLLLMISLFVIAVMESSTRDEQLD